MGRGKMELRVPEFSHKIYFKCSCLFKMYFTVSEKIIIFN